MGFFTEFFKAKAKDVKSAMNDAAVFLDSNAASEAEIASIENDFNAVLLKLGEANTVLLRERKEAKHIEEQYNKYLSIAEKLSAQMETEPSTEVETALSIALDWLETNKSEMEREKAEAVEAEQYYNEIKETVDVLRDRLLAAKKSIETAKKTMERAKLRKERAEIKAENAAALAGLRDSSNSLGAATTVMLKRAEEAEAKATALETKSEMLGVPKKTDKLIEEMLKDKPIGNLSAKDRLANLK